jgi:hypothetical protein
VNKFSIVAVASRFVCALLADAFEARHAHVDAGSATVGQKRLKKQKTTETSRAPKKKEKSK